MLGTEFLLYFQKKSLQALCCRAGGPDSSHFETWAKRGWIVLTKFCEEAQEDEGEMGDVEAQEIFKTGM